MTAAQAGHDTARRPRRTHQTRWPVVRAQRDTPLIPVQRRSSVKLAAEASKALPAAAIFRVVALPAALFAAVIIQLAIVNRLPLPAATAPDLVLLVVTAIAVGSSPLAGTVAGFAGGLALDVAPPATHYTGQYALVFCLAGYAAARVRGSLADAAGERDLVTTLAVMAAATAAGEAGKAGIGLLLSDPAVTGPVVARVLPAAILYDLLLSPVVLALVSRAAVRPRAERAPRPVFTPAQHLTGVFRQASAGAAPNLRLAGSGGTRQQQSLPRRVPNLRLSAARSSGGARTGAAAPGTVTPRLAGGRAARLTFAGDRPAPASRQLRSPGKGWLRAGMTRQAPAVSRAVPAGRRGPAKGWLHPAKPAAQARLRTPGKGWLRPARSVAPARLRTPGKGWLRPARSVAPARLRTPGKGWLRPTRPLRSNWYTRGPSTGWLRRSRTPAWLRAVRAVLFKPAGLGNPRGLGKSKRLRKPKGFGKPKGVRW